MLVSILVSNLTHNIFFTCAFTTSLIIFLSPRHIDTYAHTAGTNTQTAHMHINIHAHTQIHKDKHAQTERQADAHTHHARRQHPHPLISLELPYHFLEEAYYNPTGSQVCSK